MNIFYHFCNDKCNYTLLIQEATQAPTQLFAFLTPLAIEIWVYMVGAYILVSLTIWIAACFSPEEWKEAEICDVCLSRKYLNLPTENYDFCSIDDEVDNIDPSKQFDNPVWQRGMQPEVKRIHGEKRLDVLENEFSIGNSFWFTIGSLMQQGSDLSPKVSIFPQVYFIFMNVNF